MEYTLPKTVIVGGREYSIRSDYRAILDICEALTDPELSSEEKSAVVLYIFYPELEDMPVEDWQEAAKQCVWFINCGEDRRGQRPTPKLMDWGRTFGISWPPSTVCWAKKSVSWNTCTGGRSFPHTTKSAIASSRRSSESAI